MPNKPPMTFWKTHPILIVAESVAQSSSNGPREQMTAAATREQGRERRHFLFLGANANDGS